MNFINKTQVDEFNEFGFLQLPNYISENEVELLSKQVELLEQSEYPGHILEEHGKGYRALHGCHLYDKIFEQLIKSPKLLRPAKALLNDDVYVHQLKINLKKPFNGELWPWHQDYIYWREKDGIPNDSILSVMIFLDEVTEFNGPLFIVPKSHKLGCINQEIKSPTGGWDRDVSAELTYQVETSLVEKLVRESGIVSTKGPKGTALWFHGNIIHASPSNISPFARRVAIITYNSASNKPLTCPKELRPAFLCARDTSPLQEEAVEIA